jgi:hypothetical protein
MPILACELHVYRDDLLSQKVQTESRWVAIHTRSRQENVSMVGRHSLRISIDCPHLANRFRSAVGRLHTSHLPMHGNYVSVRCNRDDRYEVLQANLVPQTLEVGAGVELTRDPQAGMQVRRSLSSIEGSFLKHQGENYLVLAFTFLQQETIVKLHDDDVESLS